jgi:hypothetical protein
MQNWQKVRWVNSLLLVIVTLLMVIPQPVQAADPLGLLFPFLNKPSVTEDVVVVGGIKYFPNQEIIGNRTENCKIIYLGGGKYSTDIALAPIHYKDNYDSSVEQWKDIDLTIVDGKITKAPYELSIDYQNKSIIVKDKRTGSIVDIKITQIDDKSIPIQSAIVESGKVTFKDVAIDTDIILEASNSMVRFKRILKSSAAPTKATFNLTKSGSGIKVDYQARDGGVDNIKVDTSYINNVLIENIDKGKVSKYPIEIDPTLDLIVGASAGDMRVYWNGSAWATDGIAITSSDVGCYSAAGFKFGGGYRFLNVTIPNTGTITTSYLTYTAVTSLSNTVVNSVIIGDDEDNAAVFSTLANYQARRGTIVAGANNNYITTASVTWNGIPAWTANTAYNSPEIKTIIQEIVSRGGWVSGNAMVLFWDDHAGSSTAVNNTYRDVYTYDGSTTKCAKLHIEYTLPSPVPITTTNTTTLVEETTSTMNGQIIDALNPTMRGFAWGTTSNSTLPVNEVPPASYTSNYTEVGVFSTGAFSYNKTGLTSGDRYYERAYSYNVTGYGWGGEETFLTKPTEPTGFTCTSNNSAIDLTWTNAVAGTGTVVHTVIRYKTGGYPADVTDGTLSYNSTGTNYVQMGLINGTAYYFRAWTWCYDGVLSQYSDTYTGCISTPYENSVTTKGVTGFTQTTAILNGLLVVSSTLTVSQVGFDYGLNSSYGYSSVESGTYSSGVFSRSVTGLNAATVYHYRAKMLLGSTWYYGDDKLFATKGSPVPYEYWNIGGDGDSNKINSANLTYQTFTTNTTDIPHSITTVKVMLKKVGSPGTVRVSIRNTVTPTTTTFSGSYITTMDARGFAWGHTSNATLPVKENPPASYSTNYTVSGSYSAGSWTYDAPTSAYQTYYYRSYSHNATGYIWSTQTTAYSTDPYPTGADLVYCELDGNSFSTSYTWYTFTMDTEKCLTANTTYAVVIRAVAGDSSNYVMWQADSGGGYGGGAGGYSVTDGVSWVSLWTVDYLFEVWGNPCLSVDDAKVFSGYIETGDWLITLLYKNFYPPYYDQAKDVSTLFYLQLVNGTTVIAQTKCFEWGYRPGSIYLAADSVTALDWGSSYRVRIYANFSPNTYAEYALVSSDWQGSDLTRLDSWVRSSASLMETYYSTDLTEYISGRGVCLNSSGGVIFSTCIPELDVVRPNLFTIVSSSPTPNEDDYNHEYQSELAWRTLLGPQVTRIFSTVGNSFNIEGSTVGTLIGFVVYAIVALLCFPAGHAIAAIVIPVPIIIILWGTGLAELAMMAIMLAVALVLFVWQVWLKTGA